LGPGKAYHSHGLVLADINCGFSWNFFRNARWSGAFTGRVYYPPGNVAEPNNALTLGTGPEIDRGVGAFGVGMTQNYDLRIFKYKYWVDIILSAEFGASYRFQSHRRYPDFPKPSTLGNSLLDLLDPERAYFPDMADLTGKTYDYTAGFSANAALGLGISVLIFDFSATIGYGYFQEPVLDADPRFETMVRNLEMQAAGHLGAFKLAVGVNLIPFYVPLQIHYQYQQDIDGQNMIFFTKNHWLTIKGYLPTIF
jgi:hypothetical protein